MSIWLSDYMLALGAIFLVWVGVSAYVLVTRALYDFRNLSFHGARRILDRLIEQHGGDLPETAIDLGKLPRRTLAGIASDASTPPIIARAAARRLLERRAERLVKRARTHRTEAEKWRRIATLRIFSVAGSELAPSLLRDAAADPDDDVVAAAVTILGARDDDESRRLLVDALVAGRVSRARTAAQLEGRAHDLLLPLVDHPDPEVRMWAATLLGSEADRPDVALAVASLGGDPDPRVRAAVAKSLGLAGGPAAVAMALDYLDDPVWYVRAQAARVIGQSERHDLADRLLPLLADEQWWVRTAAKESLADIGGEVLPLVRRALAHEDRFARNGAAEVLHELGVVDRLVARIALDPADEIAEADLAKIFAAGGDAVVSAALARAQGATRPRLQEIAAQVAHPQSA